MDDQAWYLRTSKLALALAIIHSKPADKSSREYTEHLARTVSGQESKWRAKVKALEAEVLQLRQKQLLSRICSGSFESGGPSSQLQAQEPRSSENTSTLLEDSGCVLSNDQRTEPSEMTEHSGETCISTPFPPLSIVNRPCAPLEKPLSSHMQFLQHLLGLKTLTESESLKTDLSHFENASSTVSDSVFQLLDGLITFYREPKLPCSSFWIEAVDTLARLIGDRNLSNHILKKCSKKLEEFEKTLLQVILSNNHINRFQVQHYVSQSLVTLGSCSLLRKSIISLLLSEVNSFADDLGAINQELQDQGSDQVHLLTVTFDGFSLVWLPQFQNLTLYRQQPLSSILCGGSQVKPKMFVSKELVNSPVAQLQQCQADQLLVLARSCYFGLPQLILIF
ncbi:meiosis-specific protein MEI4 [Delphinapterus leucas]|uniref:Meiosis-specific protein MEI4 n=1 Tax=Delphinapterus leucas TaxID=9749 RepID=A0A2Y9PGX4_DELLE|nr:meiosis-specific protein MEI4 [Delphinapterus leucas]